MTFSPAWTVALDLGCTSPARSRMRIMGDLRWPADGLGRFFGSLGQPLSPIQRLRSRGLSVTLLPASPLLMSPGSSRHNCAGAIVGVPSIDEHVTAQKGRRT